MRSAGLADVAVRRLESRSHTVEELAKMMINLDRLIRRATMLHAWGEVQDLEWLRDQVMYLRMQHIRNVWEPARSTNENAPVEETGA